MNTKTAHRGRSPGWSWIGVICTCVALAASLVLAGCGGGSSETDSTAANAEQPTATTEQAASAEDMDGGELANAIYATWAEAMQKLDTLLADRPDAASVQTKVEQLKEEYVQKLVALGRQVAVLDSVEKAKMQAELLGATMEAADEDWYADYSGIYADYGGGNIDFGNLVADFNILAQYADFELLKQQSPDEAARLGVE